MNTEWKTYSKLELAICQLEAAIDHHLNDQNYVCAITLAGAAEEILGRLLEEKGGEPVVKEFARICVGVGKVSNVESWDEKFFISLENDFRNGLKHLQNGESMSLSRLPSESMIDRAVENHRRLTGGYSSKMIEFITSQEVG